MKKTLSFEDPGQKGINVRRNKHSQTHCFVHRLAINSANLRKLYETT